MNVHPLSAADVERSNWTYLVAMDVPLMRCNALLQLTGIPPSPGSKQVQLISITTQPLNNNFILCCTHSL